MDKDFDFDDVGKKIPYRVPEAFFDGLQREVFRQAGIGRRFRWRLAAVWTACVVAAFVAGLVFKPLFVSRPQAEDSIPASAAPTVAMAAAGDKWIYEMSDEELEELAGFSEYDMFMN